MGTLAQGIAPREPEAPPKLGLALSGGGFRTALFHLGVLLRLAELGVLKHVAVISGVSGGSILAGAFYLRLLARLGHARGASLSDEDMVAVVTQLAQGFQEGVRANIRTKAFESYFRNLQMCQADYSRSDRIAELYDELFLSEVLKVDDPPVRMRDLGKLPPVAYGAPVEGGKPELFVNATSLVTGRNWQFSPETMGEPPLRGQAKQIDRVLRLATPSSYDDLPEHPRMVPLSIAVAASSALPGGLHPMSVTGMYEELRIQLVDGGVHDNQGIQTLIGTRCTDFIVSDTGGQMMSEENARTSLLAVLLRTQKILYGRVRQEQLFRASERRADPEHPSPLALIHLRSGVPVASVPHSRPQKIAEGEEPEARPVESAVDFGMDPQVMELLADIRTDLDSFSEVESKSLMSAGYLVAGPLIRDPLWTGSRRFLSPEPHPASGDPLGRREVEGYLARPTKEFLRQLKVGSHRFFKVFRLNRGLRVVMLAILAALGAGAVAGLVMFWSSTIVLVALVSVLGVAGVSLWVPTTTWGARMLDTNTAAFFRWVRNAFFLAWLAALWARLYLWLLEPRFQRAGSLDRLRKTSS